MNFFVNLAMGIGNSGVEHAQFYRARRFQQAGLPYRFVFLDLIFDLHRAIDKWGLQDDHVLNIWEYLVLGGDYLTQGLTHRQASSQTKVIDDTQTHRLSIEVFDSGIRAVHHLVKYPDQHHPDSSMLLVSSGRTELFNATTGQRKVMYEERDDLHRGRQVVNIHLFDEAGKHLYFRNLVGLHRYFFAQLDRAYAGGSTFLIDRGENVDQALMVSRIPDAKLVYMVHADHLSDRDVAAHPLWNDHYEYLLDHLAAVDRVVVATQLQRQDLLRDFPDSGDKVVTIPVGGVADGGKPAAAHQRTGALRLITASRLAKEKHIDLIVKAVAILHAKKIPVTLDIYGQGGEQARIQQAIDDQKVGSIVTLKGLSDHLDTVYPQYDAFVSASYSEGFGLTYIEALNAGLPVVTFAARFGAQELIQDGINGFLQPFKRDSETYSAEQLAAGVERLLAADYATLAANTQTSVADFQDHVIAEKWQVMINALRNN